MLPWIEVEKKSVFACNLFLLGNVDVEKLYAWLIAKQVTELSFSEVHEENERVWAVYFCTEDEQLVIKLQSRFKRMALDSLRQKEQKIEKSVQEIESLKGLLQASQSSKSSQTETLQTLEEEVRRLKFEIDKLKKTEDRYRDLEKAYWIQCDKLAAINKQPSESESQASISAQVGSIQSPPVSVDICLMCGKPAMPAQGMCLACSR